MAVVDEEASKHPRLTHMFTVANSHRLPDVSKTSTRDRDEGPVSDEPPQNALMASLSRTRSRTNTILEKVSLRERIHHFTFAWYTLT